MNTVIETIYQEIGQEAVSFADDMQGKLLIYAEIEEGVLSADMFYINSNDGDVRFRFCPKSVQGLIMKLWKEWKSHGGNKEWRALSYVIDDGRFGIDLIYPDQINEDEDLSDRRPLVVKKHFGGAKVNYKAP